MQLKGRGGGCKFNKLRLSQLHKIRKPAKTKKKKKLAKINKLSKIKKRNGNKLAKTNIDNK